MKTLVVFAAFIFAVALHAADAVPQFNAILSIGKDHRFVLVDSNGKTSSFLGLGDMFAGYTLKAYDAKDGALDLEQAGKVTRVKIMADAAVTQAKAEPVRATLADAETVMNKMKFEEMMERVMVRQKEAIASQFARMGQQMVAQGSDPAEVAAFQKKLTDEIMSVLDVGKLKSETAKIYSEVFTKGELDQISAFYSTPLGEMLAAKQPEVQDRLSASIQGRMAEVMPKVQQMGREFSQAQKAKRAGAGGAPTPTPAPATKP